MGRKSRLSTGVAKSPAVLSAKPSATARFCSMMAISPRESMASLSQSRANQRSGRPNTGMRSAARRKKRTNQGGGASRSRRIESRRLSPGSHTCASSKASATTQWMPHTASTALDSQLPMPGSISVRSSTGAMPMATISACRIMRPMSMLIGISRGPQAPRPSRQRISAASRA